MVDWTNVVLLVVVVVVFVERGENGVVAVVVVFITGLEVVVDDIIATIEVNFNNFNKLPQKFPNIVSSVI